MLRLVGVTWLRCFGWEIVGERRLPRRFVCVGAHHTSAWDMPFAIATAWALGVRPCWLGKASMFTRSAGWFLRTLGGIPIDREASHGLVDQLASRFAEEPELVLAIAAEGTRHHVDRWRSGFYYVALRARVPIGLGFLDYRRRRCGVATFLEPSGDVCADMDRIRAVYRDVVGRRPERQGEPWLREERTETSAVSNVSNI